MKQVLSICAVLAMATSYCGGKKAGDGSTVQIPELGLKAKAPAGTTISKMMGEQMLQGPDLVVTIKVAGDNTPKTFEEAKKDISSTYDGVKNVVETKVPNGYILSAENKGSMGANYWVVSRLKVGDKDYACSTTASSSVQQANAVATCQSLSR